MRFEVFAVVSGRLFFSASVAFGRCRSVRLWALTGLSSVESEVVLSWLSRCGCVVVSSGCSLSSRRVWVCFRGASPSLVSLLSDSLPVAPGSRPFGVSRGRVWCGRAA
ncbi:MAG: hypothetical protein HC866_22710 [Leptolyngbyaceae cyanobacterium RU_5_1]|nr:hypothetical protein [Leptolyngbyaceae cyanobacterium RU_5_1]